MFEPSQNEYTKGFLAGRSYERDRILTILEDWTLNAQWTWADIYEAIGDGHEVAMVSKASFEATVFDRVNQERERIIDAVTLALTSSYAPALDADHNPIIDPILATVKEAIYGKSIDSAFDSAV